MEICYDDFMIYCIATEGEQEKRKSEMMKMDYLRRLPLSEML